MKKITFFLSGSVKKGENDLRSDEYFWSAEHENLLKNSFQGIEVEILNPNSVTVPKYLMKERFQADIDMLKQSNAVIVDARTKKGLGIGAEMVIARQTGIPVLTLCPRGGEYRGTMVDTDGKEREWVHPFVFELSDQIFDTLPDLIEWVKKNLLKG